MVGVVWCVVRVWLVWCGVVCSEGVVDVGWCDVGWGVVKGYGVMCPCAPYMYTLSW